MPSTWIAGETEYVPDLEALIERLLDAGKTWPYTLAWMDALGAGGRGRGVVYRGRWADAAEAGGRSLTWPREIAVPDGGAVLGAVAVRHALVQRAGARCATAGG